MAQSETMSEPAESSRSCVSANGWFTSGRFAVVLGLFICAAFPQVLLGLQAFVVRDFGFFAYPLAYYQRECFWHGRLPLWDPYNNCGVPFLAQWNTMPLYPPALIYLLLPLGWSLSFFCLAHLFWAGLGMYRLARRWTSCDWAAALAGVIFAFNGLSLNFLMWPSHIATLSWMPWVIWAVERAWQEGGRKLVVAAFLGGLQMLAGGPETILLTWLLLLGLWVAQFLPAFGVVNTRANGLARFWRFPLVVVLVAGLAAAQLLPFLDLAAHSQREQGFADTRWSMPAWGWANFLVPMVFGHVWTMGVFFQYDQSWTSSYYMGTGALLLALLAVWTVRDHRVVLLSLASGLAFCLALGDRTFVYRAVRQLLPQLSLVTYPVKFVTVLAFTVPVLAAFAATRLQVAAGLERNQLSKRLAFLAGLLLVLIGAILLWAWRWPFATDDFQVTFGNGLARAGFLGAIVILLWLMLKLWSRPVVERLEDGHDEQAPGLRRFSILLPLLLLIVLWLDVWLHEPNQNPTVSPTIYQPGLIRTKLAMNPQPELGESRAMVTPSAEVSFTGFIMSSPSDNYLVKRLGYFSDCNLLDSVPKVNGFFSLYPKECGELTSALYGSTNASFPRLEDFMSVSQITAPGKVFDWTPRASFLPLVTAGQRPIFLGDTNAERSLIEPNFNGAKVVFLSPGSRPLITVTNQTRAHVLSLHFEPEHVEFEVDAAEPSLAVISQTYYHCWRATLDGGPVPLHRANYAFQAVQVPAGRHRVELVYHDGALAIGGVLSGLTAVACMFLWGRRRPREPRLASEGA